MGNSRPKPRAMQLHWRIVLLVCGLASLGSVSCFAPSSSKAVVSGTSTRFWARTVEMSQRVETSSQICAVKLEGDFDASPSELSPVDNDNLEQVPTVMSDAARVFFLSGDYGPLMVVVSIMSFMASRVQLAPSVGLSDGLAFGASILFWAVQEHFLHQNLLHSEKDWIGKEIHEEHHKKPYHHVSIDPAALLLGWMFVAHFLFRLSLPLPLALSATVGYSMAGLFYEWAHYIVHTKVRFRSNFWNRVKDNHIRHHRVNYNYWFAFSLPWIDDLFGTNPPVQQVARMRK